MDRSSSKKEVKAFLMRHAGQCSVSVSQTIIRKLCGIIGSDTDFSLPQLARNNLHKNLMLQHFHVSLYESEIWVTMQCNAKAGSISY